METRIIRLHLTTDDGAMLLTAPKRRARMFKARSAAVQEKKPKRQRLQRDGGDL